MLRSPSPRPLAFVLAGALVALGVVMYVVLLPGWQVVASSLLRASDHVAEDGEMIWHADPARVPPHDGPWRWDRQIRDFVALAPCEARNAFLGRAPHEAEVLNVLPDARVILRGRDYVAVEDTAQEHLRELGGELDRKAAQPPGAVGILVNGDCRVPWHVMSPLLAVIRERAWVRAPMGWQVARPPYGRFLELRATLAPLDAGRPDAGDLALSVARSGKGAVVIGVADHALHFPVGCLPVIIRGFHEETGLFECNLVWRQIEARLGEVPADRRAVLRTGPDAAGVPLAYFVTLFDLLIDRRILEVALPDDGLVVRLLAPPAPLREQVPKPPEPEAVVPRWLALLTIAGMLAAFLVAARRST
jgi:hypothetical protein